MSKHAYLLIAHNKFEQLSLLISLLDDYRNDIFILIDKKSKLTDEIKSSLFKSAKNSYIQIYHDKDISWGDYSQIKAEMELFKAANEHGTYSYYHLLSGQDLPIQNQNYIHTFFDKHPNKIFLTIVPFETFKKNKIMSRVKYHYKFIKYYSHSNPHKLERIFFKLLEHINFIYQNLNGTAARRLKSLPKIGYSSNWISLNEDAVNYILSKHYEIYDIFKDSFLCDELFVPTILFNNQKYKNMIFYNTPSHDKPEELQGNLRYINWWDGSPYTWTDNDLNTIQRARELGHLFSRKFNLESSPKLKEKITFICKGQKTI
ncbi:hypothetical protein C5L30_001298 [Companilactobacillus farciminis]|uniref:Peptide O-xylosyltransferase n=2 Tax=Companilactobacillus farciminis TaxID=1612 RepID=A0A4R5NGZ0_9LACO|nr:beta-1,6-N-acetylglucosaminyltransferase [Companilactobacillus farciminis]ATO45698.1 hypothetical protein LF20184_02515 [Companilactobacillus farciminis KCTC 3681 = DSM 20184]TDG73806.1 hypothetical protein C5L30_001298 [Companilactobacillus farciminis]